ncbi:hypothetical protein ACLOJK_021855 [Asimina triloba]
MASPIGLPPGNGNRNNAIRRGTLRASAHFPEDRFLIEVNAAVYNQSHDILRGGFRYEDITLRDVLFDSSYRGGGFHAVDASKAAARPSFPAPWGRTSRPAATRKDRNFSGTAIFDLASNDNVITHVAIFSAAVGVMLRGQANKLTGVHCYNKATFFGGVGIYVKLHGLGQTRIDNCYLDFRGALFLKTQFMSTSPMLSFWVMRCDRPQQRAADEKQVDRGKEKEHQGKFTKFVADFSSDLVFPDTIKHVQYSYSSHGHFRFPLLAVTSMEKNVVVVQSDEEV